jgi:hypothetical protein
VSILDPAFKTALDKALSKALWGDARTMSPLARQIAPQAAWRLAGRPVAVEWQASPVPGTVGCCCRIGATAVLVVDPNQADYAVYRTLLHEAAHARLHFDTLPNRFEGSKRAQMPDSQRLIFEAVRDGFKGLAAAIRAEHEREAEALEERWATFADKHAAQNTIAHRLLALKGWHE